MSSVHEDHVCSGDIMRCMYCLSHVQQAYEVAKLFRTSCCNTYDNCNDSRHHCEKPLMFSHGAESAATSSLPAACLNLDTIPQHQNYQLNFQSLEQEIPHTSQTFAEISSKILPIEPIDAASPAEMCKSEYFVQENMGDRASACNTMAEKLLEVNVDNTTESGTLSFLLPAKANVRPSVLDETETVLNSLLTDETEFVVPDSLRSVRIEHTSRVNNSPISEAQKGLDGGNKTRSSNGQLQHACHINECGKFVGGTSRLYQHSDSHVGKKNYICVHCRKGFIRQHNLIGHFKKCQRAKCKAFKNSKKIRLRNGKPMKTHVCHVAGCTKIYVYKKSLRRHLLNRHRGEKNFFCQYKGFTRKHKVKKHVQVPMTGRNGYVCNISNCERYFKYEWYFKRHLDWHSGKKNFKCAHCDKGFARKSSLSLHIRVHMPRDM